jgi:hypothetical protein
VASDKESNSLRDQSYGLIGTIDRKAIDCKAMRSIRACTFAFGILNFSKVDLVNNSVDMFNFSKRQMPF